MTRRCIGVAVLTLLMAAAAAAQKMEGDLPQPISTAQLERMIAKALTAPASPWNGGSSPLGGEFDPSRVPSVPATTDGPASRSTAEVGDPLHPSIRAVLAAVEHLHDDYLAEVLGLRDRELVARLEMEPRLNRGGSLGELQQHRRQIASLRRRAIESEDRLFGAIMMVVPDPQRPRVESMRRERARLRHGENVSSILGILSLDVIELVERARLPVDQQAAIAPILADYESSLVRLGPRYTELTEVVQSRSMAALQLREAEFLGAFRMQPPEPERARRIRREALAEAREGVRLDEAMTKLADLHRNTLHRVLAALPVEPRHAVIRGAPRGFAQDDRPRDSRAADVVTRRLIDGAAASDAERAAMDAVRKRWLEPDLALAVQRMDLVEWQSNLENPWPDPTLDIAALEAVREDLRALDDERTQRGRQVLATIVSMIGRERAAALGIVLSRNGTLLEAVEWIDVELMEAAEALEDEDEVAVTVEESGERERAAARAKRAEAAIRLVVPAALTLEELRQPFHAWEHDEAIMQMLEEEHRRHRDAWTTRVEPLLAKVADTAEDMHLADEASREAIAFDLDAATDLVDEARAAQQQTLEVAWAVDAELFDALQRRFGSAERAPFISAARLTRFWRMGGGERDRSGWLSEGGQPLEIDIARWALDPTTAAPARDLMLQRIHAERAEIEAMIQARAQATIDNAMMGALRDCLDRLPVEDERFKTVWAQWLSDSRVTDEAHAQALGQIARTTHSILDAAALSLGADERADFRAKVYAAIYPGLCRDDESPVALLEQLLADEAISAEERLVVERIAQLHRATHAVATDGMIAAAAAMDSLDPGLPAQERKDLAERRRHEIARWRFERSEANAKALMHLRNELSRGTLDRYRSLALEW